MFSVRNQNSSICNMRLFCLIQVPRRRVPASPDQRSVFTLPGSNGNGLWKQQGKFYYSIIILGETFFFAEIVRGNTSFFTTTCLFNQQGETAGYPVFTLQFLFSCLAFRSRLCLRWPSSWRLASSTWIVSRSCGGL